MFNYIGYIMRFIGLIVLVGFIFYVANLINEGPYISKSGIRYYINIRDLKFNIETITIKMGDTIEIINTDDIRHAIQIDNALIPNSDLLYKYDTYEYTFDISDTYIFKSSLYPEKMNTLTVIVSDVPKGTDFYDGFKKNASESLPIVGGFLDGVWSKISVVIIMIFNFIKKIIIGLVSVLKDLLTSLINGIKDAILSFISELISTIVNTGVSSVKAQV